MENLSYAIPSTVLVKEETNFKRILLITGTPCGGKTTVANLMTSKLDGLYINLTDLALSENLVVGNDETRDSIIVDEEGIQGKILEIIRDCDEKNIIIDGHYAARVVPKEYANNVFVLRRHPVQLRKFMEQCGFRGHKLWENLASEILDVCLVDALQVYGEEKVCELDVSNKDVEQVVIEIMSILDGHKKRQIGVVDWLGELERKGLLEKYLRI